MAIDRAALLDTLANARAALLAARGSVGHWEGELSSSALSTATAVFALYQATESLGDRCDPDLSRRAGRLIRQGLAWLCLNQNADGGWGDTTLSFSNISTTCLCWAAFVADENWAAGAYDKTLRACEQWLIAKVGTLDPSAIARAIEDRYGEDRTFSVPILTMCAMAGRLGLGPQAWDLVPALPFELAAFPQRWFKWLKLPVVSYALPALIAIGQVRHALRPSPQAPIRWLRDLTRRRTLKLLGRIQPDGGGFLEATPLTSFVVMSLAAAGQADHAVVTRGLAFLEKSVREDGSWPIDTNLATWVTTLAVNALAAGPDFDSVLPEAERKPIREWLLGQQCRTEHPYTLANPGGWAWTDLPGGVPDADDTAGAILALHSLRTGESRLDDALWSGALWLLELRNRDGGVPTFCRGWGTLPFDKSSADITAHALRAEHALESSESRFPKHSRLQKESIAFLIKIQQPNGSWTPLWFGNQRTKQDENAMYGTTRVLRMFADISVVPDAREPVRRAVEWLMSNQNPDGGWGAGESTPSSIEETAWAIETIAALLTVDAMADPARQLQPALEHGVAWLIDHTHHGSQFPPTPIGFYFAKLWYWEKLYPLVWTVSALGQAAKALV